MDVDLFDFKLPSKAIALRPARPRDSARLLWVKNDGLSDENFLDLPSLLRPHDLLVFNNTRVMNVQLVAMKDKARIDLTLTRGLGRGRWQAFARPARKLKLGDTLIISDDFFAKVEGTHVEGQVVLDFGMNNRALASALESHGELPLPPYIRKRRMVDQEDRIDYQTILAKKTGAVAAPTAGLHFTQHLLEKLSKVGVGYAEVTLHVGPGTFLPLKSNDIKEHKMHSEWGRIDQAVVEKIHATKDKGGRIVAVGTTSLRLLESVAQNLKQPGRLVPFKGETDIFITPGFEFQIVDVLLTNFHLPRSTLFMLVAAFSGLKSMQAAYRHAINAGYRFYSYGDCCLLDLMPRQTTQCQ